ncbi:isoprenylcysteine carboxylmethyltransferase family protein [Pseudomaricurvus alkylphenolicus]|uniref:methyltransferase family protein n=1 Tax=Pseudomaricurvus alkylphenolicus TaxID=1306991 RepID=UPI00142164D7|nr:isoprenylcysteine carboxylmethyltransferase family protein [Pseudomaricurvus alkylphenolicus]NIB42654.1 isoprenylcysteine carboxylmethyltransferase family protein [Pseudomaricurvus alkylphenolicus]
MKLIYFFISILIYLLFWCVFSYLLVFLGGPFISSYLPILSLLKTVDSGPVLLALPAIPAAVANALLILAFGVQHSVMARSGFKDVIARVVPDCLERSVYVLATCLVLIWVYLAWQPMPAAIWAITGWGARLLEITFLSGAGLVLWSTFMISHSQLFGVRQTWNSLLERPADGEAFITPSLYKFSRHPMYLGMLIVFWATPVMTTGHFVASALFSIYIFIGIGYEERDLLAKFGDAYREYIDHVPQIFPIGGKKLPHQEK